MISHENLVWLAPWAGGLLAGIGLGLIYFLGLWATVRQLTHREQTGLWMMGSLILRLALVLVGFYLLLGATGWQGLITALLGFILIRMLLTRRLRPVSPMHRKQA